MSHESYEIQVVAVHSEFASGALQRLQGALGCSRCLSILVGRVYAPGIRKIFDFVGWHKSF